MSHRHTMASAIDRIRKQSKHWLEREAKESEKGRRSMQQRRMAGLFAVHEVLAWRHEQYKTNLKPDGSRYRTPRSIAAIQPTGDCSTLLPWTPEAVRSMPASSKEVLEARDPIAVWRWALLPVL